MRRILTHSFSLRLVNIQLHDDPAVHVAASLVHQREHTHCMSQEMRRSFAGMKLAGAEVGLSEGGGKDGKGTEWSGAVMLGKRFVSCLGLALFCRRLEVVREVLKAGADQGHGWGTEHQVTLASAAHILLHSAPFFRIPVATDDSEASGTDSHPTSVLTQPAYAEEERPWLTTRSTLWHDLARELCSAPDTKIELEGIGLPDVASFALMKGYEDTAIEMLKRDDAVIMLRHSAALLAAVRGGCARYAADLKGTSVRVYVQMLIRGADADAHIRSL